MPIILSSSLSGFCGVLVIVGANIIFLTVWMAFGSITGINIMMLVTPEDSFPYYEVTQVCNTLQSTILLIISETDIMFFNTITVLLAFLTRNIRRKHFKDTKKVNAFIYLDILTSYIFLSHSQFVTNHEIQLYLAFIGINCHAILCQIFLFLPKCLPPFLRHLNFNY